MQSEGVPVDLYIYDLTNGLASIMSPSIVGHKVEGVWHTSIVVYEREYFFGAQGISSCPPGSTSLRAPHQVKNLGNTFVPFPVFNQYIEGLATSTYAGSTYHLLDHNCNHFSDEIAQFLCGERVPKHIVSQAEKDLPPHLRAALTSMLGQLVPDSSQAVYANGVRHSRQDSPDYLTLNNQIEEARIASQELEAKRSTIAEKLARKERKKEKKRKKLREQGGAGEDVDGMHVQLAEKYRKHILVIGRKVLKSQPATKYKCDAMAQKHFKEIFKFIHTLKDAPKCEQARDKAICFGFGDSLTILHCSVLKMTVIVPVTTRCLGFYTQLLFYKVYAMHLHSFINIPVCTPYAFYRVTLAQFEYRLINARTVAGYDPEVFYRPRLDIYLRNSIDLMGHTYLPIANLLAAIGTLDFKGTRYAPICPKDNVLGILYSNLKEIVTAMANPNTPPEERRAFYDLNPLPFAQWNQPRDGNHRPPVNVVNPLLLNADDFMPPGYGPQDFENDVHYVHTFINVLSNQGVKTSRLDYKSPGHQSMLVSNIATGLRNPDKVSQDRWADEGIPQGDLDEFWSFVNLSTLDFDMGIMNLVGETRQGSVQPIRSFVTACCRVYQRWVNVMLQFVLSDL